MVAEVRGEKLLLAAGASIDFVIIADVLRKIENADPDAFPPIQENSSRIFLNRSRIILLKAFMRLLNAPADQRDTAVLSDAIIDEVYYRILLDERNCELRYEFDLITVGRLVSVEFLSYIRGQFHAAFPFRIAPRPYCALPSNHRCKEQVCRRWTT